MPGVLILLLTQILLPLWFLGTLAFGTPRSRLEWLLRVVGYGACLLYFFLTGRWDLTGYWLRYVFLSGWVLLGLWSLRKLGGVGWRPAKQNWIYDLGFAFFASLFLLLSVSALASQSYPGEAIRLEFPLRDGRFYVIQGGSNPATNAHAVSPAQRFGLDVAQLNGVGFRAAGMLPGEPQRYLVFGVPIHSPCGGTIRKVVDGLPDLAPPQMDSEHPAGNHVLIACGGVKVVLAHLQRGSVTVKVGAAVTVGQILGRVGNSGNSSEPHLHLHAARGGGVDSELDGEGAPVLVDGRFLVRNDTVVR